MDKARAGKGVIINVAIKEHLGSKNNFPKHSYQADDEQNDRYSVEASQEATLRDFGAPFWWRIGMEFRHAVYDPKGI